MKKRRAAIRSTDQYSSSTGGPERKKAPGVAAPDAKGTADTSAQIFHGESTPQDPPHQPPSASGEDDGGSSGMGDSGQGAGPDPTRPLEDNPEAERALILEWEARTAEIEAEAEDEWEQEQYRFESLLAEAEGRREDTEGPNRIDHER